MTTATHNAHDTTPEAVLFMAFELSENTWKLGFSPWAWSQTTRTPHGGT